jgi:FkbM family methyltransferase
VLYIPIGLGSDDTARATLHITEQPACSSVYPPVEVLFRHYPALAEIKPVSTVELSLRTLDTVLAEQQIHRIDAIKLDTQGSELDILRGAESALRNCALVDIEVEFNPIYEGQPLFCDVDRFLRDHGFVLWRLSDLCHYAPNEDPGPPLNLMVAFSPPQAIDYHVVRGGQLFWAQAQYVRATYPLTGASVLPHDEAIRAAAVVANIGFWDLALEILRKSDPALTATIASLLTSGSSKTSSQDQDISLATQPASPVRPILHDGACVADA